MSGHIVLKDAFRQLLGRLLSAAAGFLVITLMTPYLGPLRYGDYSTILKYFAIWSALADFGLYVIALKKLGEIRHHSGEDKHQLSVYYSKFVRSRVAILAIVYTLALGIAYLIPAYTTNPYIMIGLPLGMLFSAAFIAAGILQLPLQLYRQMKHVTIALVVARVVQIAILIAVMRFIAPHIVFDGSDSALWAFGLVVGSVLMSALGQGIYVRWQGRRFLKLKRAFDRNFTRDLIKKYWQYGIAYYLSSFHTLIVLILLSIFYPTIDGFVYVGIWALALSLVEMLLIIPSAVGNSLIHRVAHTSKEEKSRVFGKLMEFMIWIGFVVAVNFFLFRTTIIRIISGEQYLTHIGAGIGSDFLLPFFGIVLILNFIKQVCNYLFVAAELQNKLLLSNLWGIVIGAGSGVFLVRYGGLRGGIITQILLEILFVVGALRVAKQNGLLPRVSIRQIMIRFLYLGGLTFVAKAFLYLLPNDNGTHIILGILLNGAIALFYWNEIKNIAKEFSMGGSDGERGEMIQN